MTKETKTQTYTNKELGDLLGGLSAVKDLKGVKFALAVAKNLRVLQEELKDIEDAARPTQEFLALAQQIRALEEIGDKQAEIEELEGKNETLIEERKKQIEEFNTIMEETSEVSLHYLSEADLPYDITGSQLHAISLIIKD